MYYEFYIDQFFLEQLLTDGILLFLAAKLLGKNLSVRRLAAGSAVGAAVTTALIYLGHPMLSFLGLVCAGIVSFTGRELRRLPGVILALLFTTVCFGGVQSAAAELVEPPFVVSAAAAGCILYEAKRRYTEKEYQSQSKAEVTIVWDGISLTLQGFVDTGNSLQEPLSGSPVSILDQRAAGELLSEGWEMRRGFYLIPYRTIGRKKGWMRAFSADEMRVKMAKNTVCIRHPILAISEDVLSEKGSCRIILHPHHAGWDV